MALFTSGQPKPSQVKPLLLISALTVLILSSCSSAAPISESAQSEEASVEQAQPAPNADESSDESSSELTALNLGPNIDVQTASSVMDRDDVFMLDVREPSEYEAGHIPGITLIPVGQVADRLSEIPKDKEVIISCHSGARSARIFDYLVQQGYTNVHNMEGGIVAWQSAGFEVE